LLDVVIGVVFVWLLFSVVLSAAQEGLGLLTHVRSKYLWLGIGKLLNSSHPLPRRLLDVAITVPFRGTLDVRPQNGTLPANTRSAVRWWTERPTRKTAGNVVTATVRHETQALYTGIAARVVDVAKPGRLSKLTSITAEALSGAVVDVASRVHRQDVIDAAEALEWSKVQRDALAKQLTGVSWQDTLSLGWLGGLAGDSLPPRDLEALYERAKRMATPRDVIALFSDNPAVVDAIRRSAVGIGVADEITATRQVLEAHFDRSMADLSRWYRRQSRKILVILAIPLVLFAHANTIDIYRRLHDDTALRQTLASAASGAVSNDLSELCDEPSPTTVTDPLEAANERLECVRDVVDRATTFRVGLAWQDLREAHGATGTDARLEWADLGPYLRSSVVDEWGFIGRVITLAALIFGAQFWFDALRRLVGFRKTLSGTGAGSGTT
jgi:hypothetical protein